MIIRRATADDAPVIVKFNRGIASETENLNLDTATVTHGVNTLLGDDNRGFYLVAETESRIVGQLLITREWSDWRDGYFWWIQSVYIAPEFRKSGIFSRLYGHARELARTTGNICGLRLYVDSDNIRAQRAYENLGMQQSRYLMYEENFPGLTQSDK
ncbi:MAG: GNAT family N-acetyltransferase [Candidatus Neomarinimicrobiota bacterium]